MKTLDRTDPRFARGDAVTVTEEGIKPWSARVLSVKWSPESGWWYECEPVAAWLYGVWIVREADLTKGAN